MLGFELTAWDYLTFVVLLLGVVAFLVVVVFVLGLPGRIAIARRHPEADAVNIMGWVGFVAIAPCIQAHGLPVRYAQCSECYSKVEL